MTVDEAMGTLVTLLKLPEQDPGKGALTFPAKLPVHRFETWPPTTGDWADAFALVEFHDLRVCSLLANPHDFNPGLHADVLDTNVSGMNFLWGAEVHITKEIPEGTAYLLGEGQEPECVQTVVQGNPDRKGHPRTEEVAKLEGLWDPEGLHALWAASNSQASEKE